MRRGWGLLKGDVKTAFLQGDENQLGRSIFGYPPEELREAIGLEPGQLIQFAKAAYGLTIASREFYKKAGRIIHNLGLERLKSGTVHGGSEHQFKDDCKRLA